MALSGSISPLQRFNLAREAGFTAPDSVIMAAISLLECGNCEMTRVNASGDIGLWQINQIHWPKFGGKDALTDPFNSAKAAFGVWKGAGGSQSGFRQWCVYPGGCGGASPISWDTFNGKVAEVVAQLGGIQIGPLPVPNLPTLPIPGNPPAPSVPANPSIPSPPTGGTVAPDTNVGNIGPFPVNVPTGLIVGLMGVVLLLLGVLLFSFNIRYQAMSAIAGRQ